MKLRILYFGILKDHFQTERAELDLPEGSNVAALLQLLRKNSSNQAMDEKAWNSLAVAVNREYAEQGTTLHEDDEVALLPPVSGGIDAR